MMVAATTTKSGRKRLIIGLDEENIINLKNDMPIHKDMNEQNIPGLEEWELFILGPEDMLRFIQQIGVTDAS